MKNKYISNAGLTVCAEKFKPGMEERIITLYDKKMNLRNEYIVIASDVGRECEVIITPGDYIVYHKGYRFVVPQKHFKKTYKMCRN